MFTLLDNVSDIIVAIQIIQSNEEFNGIGYVMLAINSGVGALSLILHYFQLPTDPLSIPMVISYLSGFGFFGHAYMLYCDDYSPSTEIKAYSIGILPEILETLLLMYLNIYILIETPLSFLKIFSVITSILGVFWPKVQHVV